MLITLTILCFSWVLFLKNYLYNVYNIQLFVSLVAQTVRECACYAGDPGLIPGWEKALQRGWQPPAVFLENSMDKVLAWQAVVLKS